MKNEDNQGFRGHGDDARHRCLQQPTGDCRRGDRPPSPPDRLQISARTSATACSSTPTCRTSARTAAQTLNRQAEWLKKYTNYQITIAGHCDERGTREYNLALGERRANAAKQYLVAQGIPAQRVQTISYGKERPDPVGSDEAAWARNRRAVTELQ